MKKFEVMQVLLCIDEICNSADAKKSLPNAGQTLYELNLNRNTLLGFASDIEVSERAIKSKYVQASDGKAIIPPEKILDFEKELRDLMYTEVLVELKQLDSSTARIISSHLTSQSIFALFNFLTAKLV